MMTSQSEYTMWLHMAIGLKNYTRTFLYSHETLESEISKARQYLGSSAAGLYRVYDTDDEFLYEEPIY